MEIHAYARRIGNSWGIIIPKETADSLGVTDKTRLHVEMKVLPQIKDLKGTFKTRKSIRTLSKEIDEGWD
jgi:antitoxin component of MazEF toxin-antitoxin module